MRGLRKALFFLLCSALLAACAKGPAREAGADPVPAPADAATTIRVFTFAGDETLDALISAYYAKYPNDRVVKVTPQVTGNTVNMTEQLKEKAAAGEIDLYMAWGTNPMLIKENLVLPLDPYIQRANFDLKPLGPGLDNLRFDGKLYELPYAIQPQIVIYNKEIFQAAGVEPPKRGWTWDDLRAMAARLTSGEGPSRIWGFAPTFADNLMGIYLRQWGSPLEAYPDEARVKEALQLFGTMVQTDRSMPRIQRRDPASHSPMYMGQEFRNGKAAMTMEALTNQRWLLGPGIYPFAVDVAPMPAAPGMKASSLADPKTVGIVANSKHPDAAWRFIQFVVGPEGAAVVAKAGEVPLYQTPEVKNAWFSRKPAPPPGTEMLFDTTWVFEPPLNTQGKDFNLFQGIATALDNAMNATLSGEKTWEEAFAGYQRELREIQAESKGS